MAYKEASLSGTPVESVPIYVAYLNCRMFYYHLSWIFSFENVKDTGNMELWHYSTGTEHIFFNGKD